MPEHTIDKATLPSVITVGCVNLESVPRDKAATLEKPLRITRDAARCYRQSGKDNLLCSNR